MKNESFVVKNNSYRILPSQKWAWQKVGLGGTVQVWKQKFDEMLFSGLYLTSNILRSKMPVKNRF